MKKIYLFLVLLLLSTAFVSCKRHDDNPDVPNNDSTQNNIPDGYTADNVNTAFDLVFGGSGNDDDELVSGMVMDNSGNIYFSMNVTTPQANKNIIYAKISSAGTLAWAKTFDEGQDLSPDSGENGETGGTSGSISIDSEGYIYITGEVTTDDEGTSMLILKINPSNGAIVWEKKWKPEWPSGSYPTSNQDAEGYAIDAHGDYVYVTGTCGSNPVVVLALNKNDGSLLFQKSLDIVAGTKDRGYAIYQYGSDLYLGGVDGSYAWIGKLTNVTSSNPQVAYVKYAGLSYGARINQIVADAGGVYYSCDIRGVDTKFMVMKSDADGNLQWAKIFPGTSDDKNNTHVVYLNGDYLYVGGRIKEEGLSLMGDALTLKMKKSDGSLEWYKIYYTGKTNEDAAEQRVKGIAVSGNNIVIVGQIYPDDGNTEHYAGNFVSSKDKLDVQDGSASYSNITNYSFDNFDGEVRDGNGTVSEYSNGVLQNSKDKVATNPPDCDAFIIKFQP